MNLFNYGHLYTIANLLMYFLSIASFFIGIKFKKKHKEINHLYIYSLFSFLQNTIAVFLDPTKIFGFAIPSLGSITANVFIVIEFVCIYFFFNKSKVITGISKKILRIIFVTFFLYYAFKLVSVRGYVYSFGSIYFFESCLILIPCFIYIFQLFAKPPTLDLLNEPSFWFTSGILIYLTLTLPFFFALNYFKTGSIDVTINIINFFGYCLVFSFLIKAYLCNPKTII